ncbi:excalibur calcium-binding domain-containing protein [Qipengyuania sediminis]|uniref:excalibur calcium-binding domain-containing protein n=1 Tax=Qipengyuania sediminis TaxID=1532023 RepID=UPI001059B223
MAGRRQGANQDSGCAVIAVVGVLSLLISKCASPFEPEESWIELDQVAATTQYAVSSRGVNCRSLPNQNSAKVAVFSDGEALSIAEQKHGWAKVDRSGGDCWVASRLLSSVPPVKTTEPVRVYQEPRSYSRRRQFSSSFSCGVKRTCGEMDSCAEAHHYLNVCGRSRLDGDGDGVPCESIC